MPPDLIKVVALYIVEGKLLVGRNFNRDVFYGIGGQLEAGETELQCLHREVREELDCEVTEATLLETFQGPTHQGDRIVKMPCYLIKLAGVPKPTQEVVELSWIGADYEKLPLGSMLKTQICPFLAKKDLLR